MPSDIASFNRSYLPATDENTSPTSFCLSATGTSRKPKWVVPGLPGVLSVDSLMRGLSQRRNVSCRPVEQRRTQHLVRHAAFLRRGREAFGRLVGMVRLVAAQALADVGLVQGLVSANALVRSDRLKARHHDH